MPKITIKIEYEGGIMQRTSESFEIAEMNLASLEREYNRMLNEESEDEELEFDEDAHEPMAICTDRHGTCEDGEKCNCNDPD